MKWLLARSKIQLAGAILIIAVSVNVMLNVWFSPILASEITANEALLLFLPRIFAFSAAVFTHIIAAAIIITTCFSVRKNGVILLIVSLLLFLLLCFIGLLYQELFDRVYMLRFATLAFLLRLAGYFTQKRYLKNKFIGSEVK